jgi:hypothetical protein
MTSFLRTMITSSIRLEDGVYVSKLQHRRSVHSVGACRHTLIAAAQWQAVLGWGWRFRGLRLCRWRQLGLVSIAAHAVCIAVFPLQTSPNPQGLEC